MKNLTFILVSLTILQGCAVYYYDPKTGAEHVWGIGHMAMKASHPQEGQQAVVRRTDVLGIAAGFGEEGTYLALGWDGLQRVNILDRNTAIKLEWVNNNFLTMRVGPPSPGIPSTTEEKAKEAIP